MESSNLIKVVAAFVAGIVIALGSVLIYQRTYEMTHPQLTVTAVPAHDVAEPQDSGPVTGEDSSDQAVETPPVQTDNTPPARKSAPRLRSRKQARPVRPDSDLIKQSGVAQNSMPTPTSDANDAAQQGTPQQPSEAPPEQSAPESSYPASVSPQPTEGSPPQSAQTSPVPEAHTVTLSAGTNVSIRLGETLSTNDNYTGDTFRATLETPIIADGFIIADKGSKVLGQIVKAQKAGRVEGVSQLTLAVTEINTTDGQRVRIQTSTWEKKGQKSTDQDAAKIAGGAAVGAVIGAIAGGGKGAAIGAGVGGAAGTGAVVATRGKSVTLPIETRLTFRMANPVTITEKLNR